MPLSPKRHLPLPLQGVASPGRGSKGAAGAPSSIMGGACDAGR